MFVLLAHTQDLYSPPLEYIPAVGLPGEPLRPLRGLVLCAWSDVPLPGLEELVLLAPRGRGGVALHGHSGEVLLVPARR